MTDLLALAERCEAATGPDRELTAEIQVLLFEKPDYRFPDQVLNRKPSSWNEAAGRFRHDGFGGSRPWPDYTASVDAALTLVPDGLRQFGTDTVGPFAALGWPVKHFARAKSEALALCAAALRARVAQESNQ